MNNGTTWLVCGMIVLGAPALSACNQKKSPQVEQIGAREAFGELRNDFAVILDVREDSEVETEGKAEGALHLPTSRFSKDDPAWNEFLSKHPKGKKVVIYCASGGRAGKIAAELSEKGFKTANMGGFKEWVDAGLPVKRASN